ncbi:UDP-N-acetylmuramoyl-L-alanine--D-glutamate ligase [Pusillimonas sp.]|uniref:UDP-N-acetylmuramoyl-L-alanine--D-glutamate ligase n=1 Tax=Pusillimonas sp. TaxID=3040095 RepID=UPI0029ADCB60|nr:UDP-N-acetylmuramoyl-L-alanine--D-glutamate ligase [Pusillimonas sp.]MDX3896016.1 UDP-N-acetylmuramoyl-L-alanine--D-glutamate ligase [Pusillimonas sp.]
MSDFSFSSIRSDAHTLILGLGLTGAAAARWCARHGAPLRILDTRETPGGLDALRRELGEAEVDYRLGARHFDDDVLQGVGSIVISPGLSPREEPVAGLLALARQQGIEIIGEIELFARALRDMAEQGYEPKVLAVTGTNGKTTVTSMTRDFAAASGFHARAAGNIGPAALAALLDACDQDQLPDVWVLELSSFQLESTHSLAPDAAVVLNVTQDHLDWHGSMEAYAAAKARLLRAARIAVVNRDDALVAAMVDDMRSVTVRSFGRDAPHWEGDFGLDGNSGLSWLACGEPMDFDPPAPTGRRKKAEPKPQRPEGRPFRLMPVDALRVRGMHNALNAMAALCLVRCLGAGWAGMLHALRDYAGEPNRTEFVRSVGGIDFINDSKGTNVGATLAALEGLGQPAVLIAGGLGKGQDFSPLAQAVRDHARAVVLIGQDAGVIAQALGDEGPSVERAGSMQEAVERSFELARPGDAVLLSPACASMDMFRDYGHRGQAFVDAVEALALDKGEVA